MIRAFHRSPMGPASECKVEEGYIRKYRNQTERYREWEPTQAPPEPLKVHILALVSEPAHDLGYIVSLNDVFRKEDRELFVIRKLFRLQLLCQWRKALKTPFLVGNTLQSLISVFCKLFLPTLLSCFPFRPCVCRFFRDLVCVTKLTRRFLTNALTVYQGSSREIGRR